MNKKINVAVLGGGQMGSGMMRLILHKTGMKLVGACDTEKGEPFGTDIGDVIAYEQKTGVKLFDDLNRMLDETKPEIVLQATCSKVVEAADDIKTVVGKGINLISIAEEMSFPAFESPILAKQIDQEAKKNKVTVLGTGINPGFVLDLLAITLSGVCNHIESITAKRINDLSPYGPTVLNSQGVGITPEEFETGVKNGNVVGHFGFPESIAMIASAVGWEIQRIEQKREPIVSNVARETAFVNIKPGYTAGCHHSATAYINDVPRIRLIHPQQVHPHLEDVITGDYIEIKGDPDIKISGSPEIPGGVGTTALAVNMIPKVMAAAPGLKSMVDLPAPAVIMGDVRKMISKH